MLKAKIWEKIKKLPAHGKKLITGVCGFFACVWRGIWTFLCKSKRFSRFAYVTFPAKRKKIAAFLGRSRFLKFIGRNIRKIIIPVIFFAVALAVLMIATVKNSENSDKYTKPNTDVEFGMRTFFYSTFDKSDKKRGSIFLDWEDGVVNMNSGETTVRIKAKVYPINMRDARVEWSVSDEEYAEIDDKGIITVKAPGRVRIYAKMPNYSAEAEAKLLIRQPVSGIMLPTSTMTLYKGGSAQYLSARIFPANATNKNVTWSSDDPKIATVDRYGTVKPVGTGMTQIKAVTEDGGFEGRCFVTVVNPTVEVQQLTLQNMNDMDITVGESVNAVITVSPSNAKNKTLSWSSDNEAVASVSQTGRIRGVSEGTAHITARSADGISLPFEVSVSAAPHTDETEDLGGDVIYTPYNVTFPTAVAVQLAQDPPPKVWMAGGSINASEAYVAEYMDPNNYCEGAYKYQFLDLSASNGVSEEALNRYLAGKGVLQGHGATFLRAAREYGLSEIYLVAHACLETGNGTSLLSRGQEVNGVMVYNVFGIGAYDNSALPSGFARAYNEGWTSVDDAIMGGAKYISESYVYSAAGRQNTLYKMLWNPENSGSHQYATDVGWAVKQAINIDRMISELGGNASSFDVPVYNGMIPPTIENQ